MCIMLLAIDNSLIVVLFYFLGEWRCEFYTRKVSNFYFYTKSKCNIYTFKSIYTNQTTFFVHINNINDC